MLVPTLVTLALLLILGSVFTNVWTDRLWFRSVGYGDVFATILGSRVTLFIGAGLIFAGVVAVNLFIAYRTRPDGVPLRRDDPAGRYREALGPVVRPALIAIALVLFAFAGSVGAGRWTTYQQWRHGTSFGQKDPQFGRDAGFYVFDLPWYRFLTSYAFTLCVVTVLLVLFVHYVFGGIRFQGRGASFTRAARVQISIIVGIAVLTRAVSYFLDRYSMVVNGSGYVDGAGFTDVNARIPSKNILIVVAIICALLFFASIFVKSWTLPAIGLGGLVLTSILIGGIWPAIMQSFQVRPSQPDKEGPYIERNIAATREAYDVADASVESYTAQTDLSPQELTQSAESRVSSRLIDPTLVSPAFEQLQQVRGYYSVPTTLDVDRYKLPGTETPQDVVIAARELNLDGLPEGQRNWANDHTVYTHGYGVIAARGNQRGAQGEPVWVEKDIPPTGDLKLDIPPRIYFGEQSPSYSIVGRPEGAAPIEVDVPRGDQTTNTAEENAAEEDATQNVYDGKGGVAVGSLFRKVLYAVKFGEPNIVLSSRVNENSKILYERDPRTRVDKVAPWLTVDGDPYPAVVDGRVVWVLDGYTTSNNYPYSQHKSLEQATSDSLTARGSQAVLPRDEVNYVRNSVKAVVDAYDGSVKLYQWDTEDPVLKTWMKIFPGVVEPKSEISTALKEHLRYPVDLFKMQRDVLTDYHVTDPQTFFDGGEAWRVPEDPSNDGQDQLQPPYYLTTTQAGQEKARFSLTSVFTPNSRQNLAAYISVDSEASDDENYGKMQILQLPSSTQISGPTQIANEFQTDRGVTQALLQYEQSNSARILRGNLLTLPVGDGLLYVQPIYIRRSSETGSYPVLQFVIASFGGDVGFGQNLDTAVRAALGLGENDGGSDSGGDGGSTGSGSGSGSGSGTGSGSTGDATADQLLQRASTAFDDAQDALRDGDLSTYQQKVEEAGRLVDQARSRLEEQ